MRLTAGVAQKRIREISKNSAMVILGTHVRERMDERQILDVDVFRTLRTGFVDEDPEKTEYGEWKCKMTLEIRGGRKAGVVVVFLDNGKLFLKTVEWEDVP
jgi:hypothetical protein